MTKDKKIMLGALAAIGGILLYARARKKRELIDSGVDDLQKSFLAYTTSGDDLIIDDGSLKVDLPTLSAEEALKRFNIQT